MVEVAPTGQRDRIWSPEVAETVLTLENLRRQYIENEER